MKNIFQKKFKRFTAEQARAIPTDDSYITDALEEIYSLVEKGARKAETDINWCYVPYPQRAREVVKKILVEGGFVVRENPSLLCWFVSWRKEND